jgi:hypothetical protein
MSEKRAKQLRKIEGQLIVAHLKNDRLEHEIDKLKLDVAILGSRTVAQPEPVKESFFQKIFGRRA